MLSEVIADIKIFLLLLGIVLLAFGEAFLRLSETSEESNQFLVNYAYAFVYCLRLAVGDTFTDSYNRTI
jgi:hypothetical protein